MQHKTQEQLEHVAEVYPRHTQPAMTRSQRLERWAELLEHEPGRRLATLPGTEYQHGEARETMRSTDSPFSVAFNDPILRAEGLAGDRYGDVKRFFELTDRQLHNIVCYCHFGESISAEAAARHVRAAINGPGDSGVMAWIRDAVIR